MLERWVLVGVFLVGVLIVLDLLRDTIDNQDQISIRDIEESVRYARSRAIKLYVPEGVGRGVVVAAGGFRTVEAVGSLSWLRYVEIRDGLEPLDIQWFYHGEEELTPGDISRLKKILSPIDFIDVSGMVSKNFAIKAYALLHAKFEHVILLDSDCIPAIHPSVLFDSDIYKYSGNIFWPDYEHCGRVKKIFDGMQTCHETESGQIVIHRNRFINILKLNLELNNHSRIWYNLLYGDKDIYAISFYLCGMQKNFYQVPYFPYSLRNCNGLHEAIGQRNPLDGKIAFIHRTHQKRNRGNRKTTFLGKTVYIMDPDNYCGYAPGDNIYDKWRGQDIPDDIKKILKCVGDAEYNFTKHR